ncbi:hypothetical protein BC834DRAFT_974344 [Gloeopeniophorella convolvens]|nr:hypothetical protein BC834DRAFT_974344 [Gloeopeniophorella convolvens]
MSYTLFLSLTQLTNEVFPATESIKQLIQTIAHDVVRFRRNTQISYRLVDRARAACDEINALIRKVDEDEDWDSYDIYTEASDVLEELLLESAGTTSDEVTRWFGGDKDVEACIKSATSWEGNRQKLRGYLSSLHSKDSPIYKLFPGENTASEEEERGEAGKHDDASFLLEIYQRVRSHAFRERERARDIDGDVPKLIDSVNDRLADLHALAQGEMLSDNFAVVAIKTAMLVAGIMDISVDPQANKDRTHHLKLKDVWEGARRLLSYLCEETEGESAPPMEQYYDSFLSLLLTIPDAPLPASYIQLMKQAGRIRRPYHAQALALISLCRFLARHYENLSQEERTATKVEPFEEACDETLAALKAAVAAVATLRVFDVDAPENLRVTATIAAARTKIQNCFGHFGLGSNWDRYERIFQQAVEKDRSRSIQIGEILSARPSRGPSDTTSLVQVNVTVRDGDPTGNVIRIVPVGVERETRLRALRWHISKSLGPQDSARALRDSTFILADGNACRMHMSIEEITQAQSCDLTLILA